MASPFLIEIRTGGDVKNQIREITYEVANKFDVQGAIEPRPVPHITLFGPYNANKGLQIKKTVIDVLSNYDLVPYRISKFGRFKQSKVIYAKVVPSPELRNLRRELSRRLRPITYNYQPHDSNYFYDFHITIAYKDADSQFEEIWRFVNEQYDLKFDEYATRVTSLRSRNMMWEYDLLQDKELRPDEATSFKSWNQTNELLESQSSPNDHNKLAPKPSLPIRIVKRPLATIRWKW